MNAQQVWQFVVDNQLVCWIVLSIILNLLLRVKTPEQWIALCEKSPRIASALRLLRAIGVDPTKALEAGIAVVNGKARVDVGTPVVQATNQASVAPKE